MEEIIKGLKRISEILLNMARDTRTTDQAVSYQAWKDNVIVEKAIEALKRNIPKEPEIEGGGSTWWYVCEECHGAIDKSDHFCRHCGQALKGSGHEKQKAVSEKRLKTDQRREKELENAYWSERCRECEFTEAKKMLECQLCRQR